MPNYRRANMQGALYFFTVVTHNRRPILTSKHARGCLRHAINITREKRPFTIEGFVLLPDHIHTIWRLPEGDNDFPTRWQIIKSLFTRNYQRAIQPQTSISKSKIQKNEQGIWQRRYWEHLIREEKDFYHHLDYIHYNPVKHGYVSSPKDWEFSSLQKYVEKEWYDINWGSFEPTTLIKTCAGE